MAVKWRRCNAAIHRDLGYLCAGLALVAGVLARLGVQERVRGTFRPDPESLRIYLHDNVTVRVDLAAGKANYEEVRERPILRAFNFLHLSEAKKLWTWMADLYALALLTLALTGLFILRGRNGITGRGAWLTVGGGGRPGGIPAPVSLRGHGRRRLGGAMARCPARLTPVWTVPIPSVIL